jgi:LPS export ABC transporter protein LptC
MNHSGILKIFLFPLLTLLVLASSSCKNRIEDVAALNYKDTFPLETARDVEMIFSDSAVIQALIKAPRVNRYGGEDPYLVLPEGMTVYFYDSAMQVRTSMKAGYAIKHEKSNLMEARHDVVVVNHLGEKLNTEHLVWDQTKKIIYSEVFVKITKQNEVIYGQGLEADESFDKWLIKKPKGTFYINTGEDETPSVEE